MASPPTAHEFDISGEDSCSQEFDSDADSHPSEGPPEAASQSQQRYTEWMFHGIYRITLGSDWNIGDTLAPQDIQTHFRDDYMTALPPRTTHVAAEMDLSGQRYSGPLMRDFTIPIRGLIQGKATSADTWHTWLPLETVTFRPLTSIEYFDEFHKFTENARNRASIVTGWLVLAFDGSRKMPRFLGRS